jgi:cobalt-zinc-cadmium efflux system membrane fusion protein
MLGMVIYSVGLSHAQHQHDVSRLHDDEPSHNHDHDHGHVDEVHLTKEAIERHGIKVETVRKHALSATFTAPARVSYNTEAMAHVGSLVRGRIVELKVKTGDTVNKGDELFIVESPELAEAQSDFLLKRTDAEVAAITVEPARLAYDRAKSLHERNEGIALAEVQKREAEWRSAQGRLAAARGAAIAAENKLHALGMDQGSIHKLSQSGEVSPRSSARAPISGQVIARDVTLGELVNPERDALLVLADMTTLWVIAEVSEARIGDVVIGSEARIELAALPREKLAGKVAHVSPALNSQTRTASVRIEVASSAALRPGMFARAEIMAGRAGERGEVLAIPESAVLSVEGEPCVFVPVAGEEDTFAKCPVKLGRLTGGMFPLLDGLKEGQQIVVSGAFILKADLGKSGAQHQH